MQTRDRVNFAKCFYHYFYATNLIKILFKTPILFNMNEAASEEPLISRYHLTMPLTVKNPLNNEIVVSEVEFYLLKRPETTGTRQPLIANFIGTDFNYANSNDFRKMILENSIESDELKA